MGARPSGWAGSGCGARGSGALSPGAEKERPKGSGREEGGGEEEESGAGPQGGAGGRGGRRRSAERGESWILDFLAPKNELGALLKGVVARCTCYLVPLFRSFGGAGLPYEPRTPSSFRQVQWQSHARATKGLIEAGC